MRAVGLAALLVVTLGTVIFVFVELHAARSNGPPPVEPSPPAAVPVEPSPASPAASATPKGAAPAASPQGPSAPEAPTDPLDRVVQGRTRRQWHEHYAERQRQANADIERYQELLERSERGEEADARQVREASARVNELRQRMRQDLEELSRIDNAP